ncbi:hydroxyacylglutathione hydrolase [Comamonas kerstersii]|uniref:hydroxyacylglutathione hydrolase n=1 Tax=Comamonas kerstersii TaxID=225992 RepID=UPI0026DC7138|nr:hydroxyacylglutathione hydrolase [Comamonas kerstersii]
MNLLPLSAFSDNYIWLLHNGKQALVVDPGDAAPVLAALQAHGLQLQAILVTHHHADHVGGVDKLRSATGATVYGPAYETLPEPVIRVDASTELQLLGLNWRVLEVPGHTAGHIAWYCAPAGQAPILFCGDTLFSGGCGRLFEGTPEQMHASLQQLAQLPGHTRVACAHEYTLSNLKFACAVEPSNADLLQYRAHCEALRQQQLPTLPSILAQELAINPFLRCDVKQVVQSALRFRPDTHPQNPASVLATLREWKNAF